jgi:hypothetical protein
VSESTILRRARTDPWSAVTPVLVALVLGIVYVRWTPLVGDLAAQMARAQLFQRSGDVAWWTGWYGGLATSTYSLISPALLGWLGPALLGAASLVATPLAAGPLLRRTPRPMAGGLMLTAVTAADVVIGRTTFAAGAAIAVLSLSATVTDRRRSAAVAGALATFTSPVAGALELLVVAGVFLAKRDRRWLWPAGGAAVALLVLWLMAGGGTGFEPFGATEMLPALASALGIAVLPVGPVVRRVALVTAAALVFFFLVPTAMGTNLTRLVLLGAAPAVAAQARLPRRLLALCLAGLMVMPTINVVGSLLEADQPGTDAAFVAGLQTRLAGESALHNHRLELVDVATHWPSSRLVPTASLARGWERQADEQLNPELYGGPALTAATYRQFLDANAVAFVAVPRKGSLDFGALREAALIGHGLPYLRQVWNDSNWNLYAVSAPRPIVSSPASAVSLMDTGVTFTAPAAGTYDVRLRWSGYLVADGATIKATPDGDTTVSVPAGGRYTLHGVWRLP